ncbi:hypothetical protein APUTEX25_003747, partial [Auxenochlorella protothecoides]
TLALGIALGTSVTAVAAYLGYKYGTQSLIERHGGRLNAGRRKSAARSAARRGLELNGGGSGDGMDMVEAAAARAYYEAGASLTEASPALADPIRRPNSRPAMVIAPTPALNAEGGDTTEYYATDADGMAHFPHPPTSSGLMSASEAELGGPLHGLAPGAQTHAHAHGLQYIPRPANTCLRKWLFKPVLSPEQLSHLAEAKELSDCIGDPFRWTPAPCKPDWHFRMVDGVYCVWDGAATAAAPAPEARGTPPPPDLQTAWLTPPGTAVDFFSDMHWLLRVSALGNVRSFTHHRLLLLEQKFNLHVMLNSDKEFLAQKSAPHRDFYNVRKVCSWVEVVQGAGDGGPEIFCAAELVDTHVHHSACMHQKHLLRFMKSKLKKEPDEASGGLGWDEEIGDGKYLTLREVFESLNLTPYDLNVDMLDVHADKNIFQRFDRFNLKYNPFGQSRLREIFIKQDNLLHGRFLAQLTKEVFVDLEASKYQHTEYRISVYGRKPNEWDTLAAWVVQNRLASDNNMWLIQIPRLYNVYKESGIIDNFEELLVNIFEPLFEVTKDPESHPQLHLFLKGVSGFDLVDDESKPERRPNKHMPSPAAWNTKYNPSFAYYVYYMYANLFTLNKLREARGLNTFSLRPHSGEAGDVDHLAVTFMAAENIAHGINLRKSPSMQYLYYLAQVGLCMSPLSNNFIFLDYHRNPFPTFFARGLSVSLSTDDPLQIHLTKEPLVEEYSVAAQVWKLSATDLCEIARNSVLHSGYPHQVKMHWVHTKYWKMGPEGNDIQKTNVPALRMRFRKDCHTEEVTLLQSGASAHANRLRERKPKD